MQHFVIYTSIFTINLINQTLYYILRKRKKYYILPGYKHGSKKVDIGTQYRKSGQNIRAGTEILIYLSVYEGFPKFTTDPIQC